MRAHLPTSSRVHRVPARIGDVTAFVRTGGVLYAFAPVEPARREAVTQFEADLARGVAA